VPHLRCSDLVVRCFPALTGWVNVCRAYGADGEKRSTWSGKLGQGGEASPMRGTCRNDRAFMRWLPETVPLLLLGSMAENKGIG
jgi:hypothetical protein